MFGQDIKTLLTVESTSLKLGRSLAQKILLKVHVRTNIGHTLGPNLDSHPSRRSMMSSQHLTEAREAYKSLSTSQGRRDI